MQPRRQPETTPEDHATPTVEPKKKGSRSDGVLAGQLFTRLAQLDADELSELAASPSDIKARFDGRRSKALAEVSEEVRILAMRMRGE